METKATKQLEIAARLERNEKQCCACSEVKDLSEFNKEKNSPDGRKYVCRQCDRRQQREYRNKIKQHQQEQTTLPNGYATWAEKTRKLTEIRKLVKLHLSAISPAERHKKAVYVSLPIGYGKMPRPEQLQWAKERAEAAALQLCALGYRAVTPFTIGMPKGYNYEHTLLYCLHYMEAARPIMLFMDGWNQSKGCYHEWMKANDIGLTCELEAHGGFRFLEERAKDLCIHPDFKLVV